jgi:hypothetical protein
VLFLGQTPSLIAGKTILNASTPKPGEFSWASVVPGELSPTPTPSDDPPAQPPAPQVIPPSMLQAILSGIPDRDIILDRSDAAWRIMNRRWKDADVYLVFNEGAAASTHTVSFIGRGKRMEAWDPQTGQIEPMTALKTVDGLKVSIALQGFETRVLVMR